MVITRPRVFMVKRVHFTLIQAFAAVCTLCLANPLLILRGRLRDVMASTSVSALEEILADRELFRYHFGLSHQEGPFDSDESDLDVECDLDADSDEPDSDDGWDRWECDGKQHTCMQYMNK